MKTVLFLILGLAFIQVDRAIAGNAVIKLPCKAESVDLAAARSEAISDCITAAAAQIISAWHVKSETYETEQDVAVSNTTSANQEITDLNCNPSEEKDEEGRDSVKVSLSCTFDLAKVKTTLITEPSLQRPPKADEQYRAKSITVVSTPPCASVIVRGASSTRILRCAGNPFVIGLHPDDRNLLIRADDYAGKTIDLENIKDETVTVSFANLSKENSDSFLGYYCQGDRALHRMGGRLTFDFPTTTGMPLDQAARVKNAALSEFRRRAKLLDSIGQYYVDYADVVHKAVGAQNPIAVFQNYFDGNGEKDVTPARAESQGLRLIAIYLKENYVLAVPPNEIDKVFREGDHATAYRRDLVQSFVSGHPVASRILRLREHTWLAALVNTTKVEEKISDDGRSVTFLVNTDLKTLCPFIHPINTLKGE